MSELTPGVYVGVHMFSIHDNLCVVNLSPTKPTAEQKVIVIPFPIGMLAGFYNLEVGVLPDGVMIVEETPGIYFVYDLTIGGCLIKTTNNIDELLGYNQARAEIYRLTTKSGEVIYDGRSKGVLPPSLEKIISQREAKRNSAGSPLARKRWYSKSAFSLRVFISRLVHTLKRLART